MILIINSSFGVGKTTVAKLVAAQSASAMIYDPERWGYILQRLPHRALNRTERVNDFQELPLWESLIARGIGRSTRRSKLVVVPMAFSDAARLDRLRTRLQADANVLTICLTAPLDVIFQRLAARAAKEGRPVSEFERRRSLECVLAHGDPVFGTPVDATASADDVAVAVVAALGIA